MMRHAVVINLTIVELTLVHWNWVTSEDSGVVLCESVADSWAFSLKIVKVLLRIPDHPVFRIVLILNEFVIRHVVVGSTVS